MPDGATFDSFQRELSRLVETFGKNIAAYKSTAYDEASLRQEFLNPFFRALGWDIENKAGLIPQHREVETESRTQIGGRQKRADYLFRTHPTARFICEAKKPAEKVHATYAFQAKRYAWNKGLALAVLTDFEEMKVFIVGGKPFKDEPDIGLWKTWHFLQYPLVAQELWNLLSRERVAAGSIDQLIESLPNRPTGKGKGKQGWLFKPDRSRALDTEFLNFLDEARRELASDLLKQNDRADLLEGTQLNEAVQRILDRILFLRICEDRDIDTGRPLDRLVRSWRDDDDPAAARRGRQQPLELHEEPPAHDGGSGLRAPKGTLWHTLVRHFRALDRRPPSHIPFFNGNLFKPHFSEELIVSDDWLAHFLDELGDEESPYLFNYIPVEILGTIYERFLGKVVRPHGRGVTIEEKPEVRKAGGVYYTPRYIVEYIVSQTVGKLLAGRKPEDALKLRILDPACGSGSFLIHAFEVVSEHCQQWLTDELRRTAADEATSPKLEGKGQSLLASSPTAVAWLKKHRDWCWLEENAVHLTTKAKRRILRETIYGVDLDPQAVEVTQLSLYLKMLENENRATLAHESDLFGSDEALLPPLEHNIKCGNSLIASDFTDGMLPTEDSTAALNRVHAFNWPVQFPTIMKAGGFDAVVGNPPYIRIQGFPQDQVSYFVRHYRAATGNYDVYVNFVERGLRLLGPNGRLGMILPNKFFRTDYGLGLRSCLSEAKAVARIVDFGAEQVFEATTYTCLLFLGREQTGTFDLAVSKAEAKALEAASFESRPAGTLDEAPWTFTHARETALLKKVKSVSKRLLDLPADMSRGSSSGDDEIYVVEAKGHGLEAGALRIPLFASDFGRYFLEPSPEWRIVFPYAIDDGVSRLMSSSELHRRFPKAFAHLQRHSAKLRERKQFREWFGYSAPRNLELHDRAHIAVPLLANKPVFALITNKVRGSLCPMASGGFTITLSSKCPLKPEFVLGLLNSKLLFWCLRQVSNVFRGGWITCTKQYFGELPIVSLDLSKSSNRARHDLLVELVGKLLIWVPKLRAAKSDAERQTLQNAVTATDQQIDALVYELYGLTPEEIALVEGAA